MSPSIDPLFPPRNERDYAAAAVETFPWPVVAGYEDVHRWMDQGQAVHAAWQLKDVWEGLLKFLATLAVADHLAAAPAGDPRTRKLLDQLLKKGGLTDGDWAKLMEIALEDGPLSAARLPQLAPLLVPGRQAATALPPVHRRQGRHRSRRLHPLAEPDASATASSAKTFAATPRRRCTGSAGCTKPSTCAGPCCNH